MPADVETMMFEKRELPWHGLGTPVDGCQLAADAIGLAGLDWSVEKCAIASVHGPNGIILTSDPDEIAFATVRVGCPLDDAPKILGLVGNQYRPVQNAEAFAFLDGMAGGKLRYDTAGSLQGGRKIWMLASLRETPELLVGGVDAVTPYLLLANDHSGNGALNVLFTATRVVCSNTLSQALAGAKRGLTLRHTDSIHARMASAEKVLAFGEDTVAAWGARAEAFYSARITPAEWIAVVELLLPLPDLESFNSDGEPRAAVNQRQRTVLEALAEGGTGMDLPGVRGSIWGAYNAITEFATHEKVARGGDEGRLNALWFGGGNDFITDGTRLLQLVLAGKGHELIEEANAARTAREGRRAK